jgi:hypothetical protein
MISAFRLILILAACVLGGCAGSPPRMFPALPSECGPLPDGGFSRGYDTDADGRTDAFEILDSQGLIVAVGGTDGWQANVRGTVDGEARHLLIILDSVPYQMIRDLWQQGRFRVFHPPGRVIAPFPVMTDVCLAEFFDVSPCPGLESSYYDGERLTSGYDVYADNGNVPWHRFVDYHL